MFRNFLCLMKCWFNCLTFKSINLFLTLLKPVINIFYMLIFSKNQLSSHRPSNRQQNWARAWKRSVCVWVLWVCSVGWSADLTLTHHLQKSFFTQSGMLTFTVRIFRFSPRLMANVWNKRVTCRDSRHKARHGSAPSVPPPPAHS